MDEVYTQMYNASFDYIIICNYLPLFVGTRKLITIATCKAHVNLNYEN
jgi:hypothetical protein